MPKVKADWLANVKDAPEESIVSLFCWHMYIFYFYNHSLKLL